MYSFAQRPDMTVVDEPLYAHYLSKTDTAATHPGTPEVLASQVADGERVVREVIFGQYQTPAVMFKQMTHHLIHLDWSFMLKTQNILLIRDPREIIFSYSKVIPNPSIRDIGVEQQYELYQFLKKDNALTAVVDARELLLDPARVLTALCEKMGLTFDQNMLKWEAGPRPEDGVWAKYWYAGVHQSTGFQVYQKKDINLPVGLEYLALRCQPYYEALYREALKANS
jgi:hypothetical protein